MTEDGAGKASGYASRVASGFSECPCGNTNTENSTKWKRKAGGRLRDRWGRKKAARTQKVEQPYCAVSRRSFLCSGTLPGHR